LPAPEFFFCTEEEGRPDSLVPESGMNHDPVKIIDPVGERSLSEADVSPNFPLPFPRAQNPIILFAGMGQGDIDQLQGHLELFGMEMGLGSEEVFQLDPVLRLDFPDLHGFDPSSRTRTSSNLDRSTEGVTSIYWKIPGRFRSTWLTVPTTNPLGKTPPRPEVTTVSPT